MRGGVMPNNSFKKCVCSPYGKTFLTIESKHRKYYWCSSCGALHSVLLDKKKGDEDYRIIIPRNNEK
jgi:hypothetical protein